MQRSDHENTIVLSTSERPAGAALWLRCAQLTSPLRLTRFPTTLGSARDCGVRLTAKGVSPHHASIVSTPGGGYAIERLCPKGRLQVNGYEMAQVILADGDVLTLGAAEITLNMTEAPCDTEAPSAQTETQGQKSAPKRLALMGSLLAAISGAVAVYAVATDPWGSVSASGPAAQGMAKGPDATTYTAARAKLAGVGPAYSPAGPPRHVLRIERTLTKETPATTDPRSSAIAGPVARAHTDDHEGPGGAETSDHTSLDRAASSLRTALDELNVAEKPVALPPPRTPSANDSASVTQIPENPESRWRSPAPDAVPGTSRLETLNTTQMTTPTVQLPKSGAATRITGSSIAAKNAALADDPIVDEHTQTRPARALALRQTQTANEPSRIGTGPQVDAEASRQRRKGQHMLALQKAVEAKQRKEVSAALVKVTQVTASRALAQRPQPRRHDPVAQPAVPPRPASAQTAVANVSLLSPTRNARDDGAAKLGPLASRAPATRVPKPRLKLAAASPSQAKQKPASRRHAPSSCGGR